ncbi:sodium:proton antiporter [uncultured Salinisphaera sp.]|uniref:cation:proton antiporter n=1 Tax=uncultured Salinisphaera sp. TaxID=359372 RepID=UPI0032B1CCDA
MGLLQISAIVVSLAAVLAFVNYRLVGLPTTIGVMLLSLMVSAALVAADYFGVLAVREQTGSWWLAIDFNRTLMDGMLSFLLFAGALQVNLGDLWKHRFSIGVLASVGVVLSTAIIGCVTYLLVPYLGFELSFVYCLLFGALITPTDPIAVLALLKQAGVSQELETNITGESLFNDGVAVVVFLALLGLTGAGHVEGAGEIALLFVQEVVGGALLGLALGGLAFWMLRRMDDHQVEILVTLAVVLGGYQLALVLHASGPIAMVIAGLLVGNHGRLFAMSDTTRAHLDTFWEIVDEILNTVLFVMIGLEMVHITLDGRYLLAGVCAIPLVLITRYGCVSMALQLVRPWHRLGDNASALLTWAGLRGGISVALALALPPGEARDTILTITYCVVLFSIVVQGLSVGRVIRRLNRDL